MACLEDAFRTRDRATDPPRPGYSDGAIAALDGTLRHMRQGTGTGWQMETAVTQALLGFAQLHRSGIADLTAANVGQSQQAGGARANFANGGLRNLYESRQALDAMLNPPQGQAHLAAEVRQELQTILAALPTVTRQGDHYSLTGSANRDALMQIGLRHDRNVFRRYIQDVSR
jgi:hypothetical protein